MARVLVVDDRAHVRGAVRRVLVQGGHQVWGARNGAEALALLDAIAFDLVVTNVYMWVADGMESLARLPNRRWSPDPCASGRDIVRGALETEVAA